MKRDGEAMKGGRGEATKVEIEWKKIKKRCGDEMKYDASREDRAGGERGEESEGVCFFGDSKLKTKINKRLSRL